MKDFLSIENKKFKSRLFMGTSRYPNHQIMLESLHAGRTEVVTVAIRRISLKKYNENIIDLLKKKYFSLRKFPVLSSYELKFNFVSPFV